MIAIYNLPPWLCTKSKYIMLTVLIQGPKQPGNDIDVYLEPLIDDLKKLWSEGIQTYDVYRRETFTMRAMLLCTVNDFPAYGNLSGYRRQGKKACLVCKEEIESLQLQHGKKTVYLGHRRFLLPTHPYRRMRKAFNGKSEDRKAPIPLTRIQVFEKVKDIESVFGKIKKNSCKDASVYKKRSILWELLYWKHLNIRHCIDVMHIGKYT